MVPLIIRIAVAAFFLYPYIDGLINTQEDVPTHIYLLVGIFACWVFAVCFPSKGEYFTLAFLMLTFALLLGGFGYPLLQSILDGDVSIISLVVVWILLFIFDSKRKKKS